MKRTSRVYHLRRESEVLHAKVMSITDKFLDRDYDAFPFTLACIFGTFGKIALQTDLRWKAEDTASLMKRCAAKAVGLMGLPTGTTIDIETCDTTLRKLFLENLDQLLVETGGKVLGC